MEIGLIVLQWYLIVQLIALVALPMTLRIFAALPDRGYAFSKSLGVFAVGLILWLGTSYGVLRNETGGAWLSLLIVATGSFAIGWPILRNTQHAIRNALPDWRVILLIEILFLLAFAAWTWVRAHDPAINHTEQPMDLMFMNGIWTSPTFPPRDPWLAGYAISYYYFGYWLLVSVARLAAQPPEIAYNVGQACWFGLLVIGSFGVGYNLVVLSTPGARRARGETEAQGTITPSPHYLIIPSSIAGGLLTTAAVALAGNLHAVLEWFYAQGVPVTWLADWAQVHNFPEQARVTNQWFIDAGWSWWWRSSRVIGDTDLLGNHIEVIAEFPIFSYVLGDNHPHVLAMPFVLLVVALAMNFFFWGDRGPGTGDRGPGTGDGSSRPLRAREPETDLESPNQPVIQSPNHPVTAAWQALRATVPFGAWGIALLIVATGALLFLNTWDFPPYWALLTLVAIFVARRSEQCDGSLAPLPPRTLAPIASGIMLAVILLIGAGIIYFPYFLTAQSQAAGIVPNFFNATRLPQFLLMWGHFLLGIAALIGLAWRERAAQWRAVGVSAGIVLGIPLLFLMGTLLLAANTEIGRDALARMPLPPGETNYVTVVLARWGERIFPFLLAGGLAATVIALLWRRWQTPAAAEDRATTFALLLAGIGLLLIYAPEWIFLRDNFGTRMNTVFKFYYQGWLLLGVSSSYAIVGVLRRLRLPERMSAPSVVLAVTSLILIGATLIYPVAGAYAKVTGFGTPDPTLNGLAYLGTDEAAAIEWVRRNTRPDAIVLQARGRSYWATDNRLSAATGRATLLGWDGHESQWRGADYAEMAAGRPELIETIYRGAAPETLAAVLAEHGIDYVYVGNVEREQYGLSSAAEARFGEVMDVVFEQGDVRIYRRRG